MDVERTQQFIEQYANLAEFFNYGAEMLSIGVLPPGVDEKNDKVREIVRKCGEFYIKKKSKEEVFGLEGGITVDFGSIQFVVDHQNGKVFKIIVQEEFPINELLSLVHGIKNHNIDYDGLNAGKKIPISLLDEPNEMVGIMYIDSSLYMEYCNFAMSYPMQAQNLLNSCNEIQPDDVFVLTFHYVKV